MARRSSLAVRSYAPARRSGPSPKLKAMEARVASIARKTRDVATANEEMLITVGVPAALGFARASGHVLPTFANFHPLLVWGLPMALLGEKVVGGAWGKRVRAAGVGMLACASNDAAHRGTLKVEGDDIAGDEIAGDDDDDE